MTSVARPPRRLAAFEIASVPGSERTARTRIARAVASCGLSPAQLDKLGTAVGEATMNAIEHGNRGRAELPVEFQVFQSGDEVVVTISDRGGGGDVGCPEDSAELPDLARKLAGEQDPRGWGLFLIRHMVDSVDVTTEGERHTVRLTIRGHGSDE